MSARINMMVCIGSGFGAFGHNKVASASKYDDGVYVIHGMWKRNENLLIGVN